MRSRRFFLTSLIAIALSSVLSAGCASRIPSEIIYAALGASDAVGIGAVPIENGYVGLIRDADGFHPNNRGHEKIAEAFLAVVRPALELSD